MPVPYAYSIGLKESFMNKIYACILAAVTVLIFTACSGSIKTQDTSSSPGTVTQQEDIMICKNIIHKYYECINNGDKKSLQDLWGKDLFYSGDYQNKLDKLPYHFRHIRMDDVSIADYNGSIPVGDPMLKTAKYSMLAFITSYTASYDEEKSYYLNNGSNSDYIYMIKSGSEENAGWKIYQIENKRVMDAQSAVNSFYSYISKGESQKAIALCEAGSSYYKEAEHRVEWLIDQNLIPEDIAAYIYPKPFILSYDKDKYESIAFVTCYSQAASGDNSSFYDYIYLTKEKGSADSEWKVWKIEPRENQEGIDSIKAFYSNINSGSREKVEGFISTVDLENYSYYKNYIEKFMLDRIKTIRVNNVEVFEGPPGGDFYIEGYSFYHFKIDGEVQYKNLPENFEGPYEKNGEFTHYIYLIKGDNDSRWLLYSIADNP